MKKYLLAAAAVAAISTPAAAQEDSNFSGAKVGVVAGFDNYKIKYDGEGESRNGFHYGVTAGYDYNIGGGIVGLEVEASDATTKETYTDGALRMSLSAERELYVGVRAGAELTPKLLAYVKAGYVDSKLKLRVNYDGERESGSDTLGGYRLGAGLEISPSTAFGRLEYRFSDFGDYEFEGYETGLSSQRHQIVATIGTRF